ncbi:MAG TPA: hypothetical protein PK359_16150 [Burkholderiaceae bacterium]|jgi:DNA-3-methyladenine glycosylase II|nr:hypothetical protein [Burkholderiaceae bacterium]
MAARLSATAVPVPPAYWPTARRSLARRDRVMGDIMRSCGPVHLVPRTDPFLTLARSIVGQQISVAAAQTIWSRVEKACGTVHPDRVSRMREATLLRCGLSARKVEYLRDLSGRFRTGALDPVRWQSMDDESVIGELTQVHGIGRWTAEMFLIFNLLRPDVLPLDDIGLLRAIALKYPAEEPDVSGDDAADSRSAAWRHRQTRRQAEILGERWRPWRSAATWYLWRSLDPVAVEYKANKSP